MTTDLPPLGTIVETTPDISARPVPGTVVGYASQILSPMYERAFCADLLPQTLVLVEFHEQLLLGDTGLHVSVIPLHPDSLAVRACPRRSMHHLGAR